MKRGIFLQDLVQRDADLLLVLARLGLDRKGDGRLRIFDRVVNDSCLFVAQRVAGLCLFQLYTGDDIAGVSFTNLIELFSPRHMKCAEPFSNSSGGIQGVGIGLETTADDLEYIYSACKRIGNSPETIGREWFAVAVLAPDPFSIRTCIDRLA